MDFSDPRIQLALRYVEKHRANDSVRGIVALLAIGVVNGLFNRSVLLNLYFDYPVVILMLQMAALIVGLKVARASNHIELKPYTFQRGGKLFFPSLFYAIINYLMLDGVDGITLPLFLPLFRFLPAVILATLVYSKRCKTPSPENTKIIGFMCTTAFFVSLYSSQTNVFAIPLGLVSLLIYGFTFLQFENLRESTENPFDLIYANAVNCFMFFIIADFVNIDLYQAYLFIGKMSSILFVICFTVLILAGAAFHGVVIYCIFKTNAFHTANAINFMSAIQIVAAYVIAFSQFYDVPIDTEDKSYVYFNDGKILLNTGTLPNGLRIHATTNGLILRGYSEKLKSCQDFGFHVQSPYGNGQFQTITAEASAFTAEFTYICSNDPNGPTSSTFRSVENILIHSDCGRGYDVYFTLINIAEHTCNLWLSLDSSNNLDPFLTYPVFAYPTKEEGYYLIPRAPKGFEERASKLVINVQSVENKTYTFYKMIYRPIPTIEITTPPKCSNFEVFIDFDATCTVSMEFLANDIKITNTKPEKLGFRPKQTVLTFTYSGVYFYTFEPLSMRHLDKCIFSNNFRITAEFTMRVWYNEKKKSESCNSVEIVFVDDVAMKPPLINTTPTEEPPSEVTTDTTALETETDEERETSSASTKVWSIVALVICVLVVIIVGAVIMIVRFIKKH
uniref:DUF4384 domain-containing protein n=1 Tax=Panagrellus redivivus TaxID=6233 RepID=A0A7E4VIB4_PANRE